MRIPSASVTRRRRGAAIAIALVALTVVAMLAAGAALASRQAARESRGGFAEVRARVAAEGALVAALRPWDRRRNQAAPGGTDSAVTTGVVTRVVRLDADRFLVEASARAVAAEPGPGRWAERAATLLVRLVRPMPTVYGAVTTGGALVVPDGAIVDGVDAPPPGWLDCPAPGPDALAVAAASAAAVRVAPGATVRGGVQQHAAAVDTATYARFGPESWAALAARADVALDGRAGDASPAPSASGADCVIAASAWSDPSRAAGLPSACATTYALVHAVGGLTVRGPARGQGVLLVDGDLTLDGDFTFAGVIVVRGAVRVVRGALRIDGALLAANGGQLGAGSRVGFSRCAVTHALDGVARALPLGRRAWAEVTR